MPRPRLLRELPVLLSLLLLVSEYPPMLLANDPVLLYPKNTVFQVTIVIIRSLLSLFICLKSIKMARLYNF